MAIETSVSTVGSLTGFPSHDVAPDEKDAAWCTQYLRAMYTQSRTTRFSKMFYGTREEYHKFKEYGLAEQSTIPYRKQLTGSEAQDKTWSNINWEVPSVASKYRNILINKLLAREYNITCTPVDPEAVDSTAKWFADLKAKTMMAGVAKKINPELLQTTALAKKADDPENMEDFEMRTELGFKTKMAMDAELGIQVVFTQNNMKQERKMVIEDLVDLGVGIYKDYIDENDNVMIRRVDPMNFICNWCHRGDFKDMHYGAEPLFLTLADISPYFSPADLKTIAEKYAGKNGNPEWVSETFSMADYDQFTVTVLDGEWKSYNTEYYKRSFDSKGNYGFRRKRPDRREGKAMIDVNGVQKPKYMSDETDVVYKGKWIVDSEFIYDYGLASDQKRKKSTFKKTSLSYHAYAPDFYKMSALGIMKRMIPMVDEYCLTSYKIQNFRNRWIPYIINIDLAALENIPLGKGGKKLTPMEVLDMLFQTNILVSRSKNAISGVQEGKNQAVNVQATQMAQEITVLATELQRHLQGIRDVTGLNEAVDGTGPAQRTNVPAQEQAQQGSNNAISHFADADSSLIEDVADSALLRLQRVLRRKKVSGYVHSLGTNYVKFVQVSPDITAREYALKIEDRPDDQMKQMFLQNLALKDQQGLILPEDYFTIMNMTNVKEMENKLVYSTKKRQEQMQAAKNQDSQNNAQAGIQTAQAAEEAKQATIRVKGEEDRKTEDVRGSWAVKTAQARTTGVIDQESLVMIKEIIMQAMDHSHDQEMAATGAASPESGPQPAQGAPAPQPGPAVAASLQE